MALSLDSVKKGKEHKPPRIILLGTEKIGKSTFASQTENPIFVPIKNEEGIDPLDIDKFPTCQTFQDVVDALGALYQEDHQYGTVVIDSASALEPLIWSSVCERHGTDSIEKVLNGFGKGYIEALYEWRQVMEGLDALREEKNMASILIGHVRVKRFDDPTGDSYDQYQFDVADKAANALYRWCDSILFANTKVNVKKEEQGFGKEKKRGVDTTGGERFLFTQHRPAHPGGGRGPYGQIPYELPLDWNAFMQAVAEASQ